MAAHSQETRILWPMLKKVYRQHAGVEDVEANLGQADHMAATGSTINPCRVQVYDSTASCMCLRMKVRQDHDTASLFCKMLCTGAYESTPEAWGCIQTASHSQHLATQDTYLAHSDLPHQLVLVSVHAGQLANMREGVL